MKTEVCQTEVSDKRFGSFSKKLAKCENRNPTNEAENGPHTLA